MGHSVVIGVDPGKTTGFFLAHRDRGVQHHQLGPELYPNHGSAIYSTVAALRREWDEEILVAIERFVITAATAKKTRQPEALEVLGSLRDQLSTLNHVIVVLQTSSEAKRFVSNDMLQALGWYARGKRHANDAARHALLALSRSDFAWYSQLMENVVL